MVMSSHVRQIVLGAQSGVLIGQSRTYRVDLGDSLALGAAIAVHEVDELVLSSALDPDSGGVVSAPPNT